MSLNIESHKPIICVQCYSGNLASLLQRKATITNIRGYARLEIMTKGCKDTTALSTPVTTKVDENNKKRGFP